MDELISLVKGKLQQGCIALTERTVLYFSTLFFGTNLQGDIIRQNDRSFHYSACDSHKASSLFLDKRMDNCVIRLSVPGLADDKVPISMMHNPPVWNPIFRDSGQGLLQASSYSPFTGCHRPFC